MTDSPAAEPATFPFTPVPTRARHDGWTPDRQRRFIEAVATLGNVSAAARAVGSTRTSAYRLRARPGADSFAAAWDLALSDYRVQRFDALFERAVVGVTLPRKYRNEFVGVRHAFDTAAAIALLRRPMLSPTPETTPRQR